MTITDAVKKSSNGVIIDLEVIPESKNVKIISGYNPWRKRITVKLTQPPQKGKANKQLIEELSKILMVSESDITLISGQTSHKKTVLIKGMEVKQVLDLLKVFCYE
ncbi:MAG: DUF167 domain-containing protein [Euryarchaeota archaeon]|nr:DUF167 domain-containing protein [Euryarchaeota archaeon]